MLIFIFIRNPSGGFQPTTLCQPTSNAGAVAEDQVLPPRHRVVGVSPGSARMAGLDCEKIEFCCLTENREAINVMICLTNSTYGILYFEIS